MLKFRSISASLSALVCLVGPLVCAADEAAKPDASKMPHMRVDVKNKQVWVECQALNPQMPLEFFCCMTGTAEHEAVLRSEVRPQHLHLGLLMLGLQPGEPVHYSKAADKWLAPHGPPLQISCEWDDKDGKKVHVPAYRMMRNVKNKKDMPAMTWIFAGSRVMEDGKYAADTTGYIVSVVNFDYTVIDIPELASSANETLEWEYNPTLVPEKGHKIWMIIEPAGKDTPKAADKPAAEKAKTDAGETGTLPDGGTVLLDGKPLSEIEKETGGTKLVAAGAPDAPLSDVQVDEKKVKALRAKWDEKVAPKTQALREAAQAHYEVVNALRREQNRLIDEADRIQRVIDQVQKEYQDMTTPRPETEEAGK
jgi:hypothetical protein